MPPRHAPTRRGPVHTVIDAHNLIYADAQLRAYMDEPEAARAALLALVHGVPRLRLVCDGGPGGQPSVAVRQGVTVVYSGRRPADDAIVDWLVAHPQLHAVVVTDDGALARRARIVGARVLGCVAFLQGLPAALGTEHDARRAPPSAAEVERWLSLFGIVPGADGSESTEP